MSGIKTNLFIFYVKDQKVSCDFYKKVLGINPILDVPGMTEFKLGENTLLGLMPISGIKRILGDEIIDPNEANGIPRSELYLSVSDASVYQERAIKAGANELTPILKRDWGESVGYVQDLDGHVLAFGEAR